VVALVAKVAARTKVAFEGVVVAAQMIMVRLQIMIVVFEEIMAAVEVAAVQTTIVSMDASVRMNGRPLLVMVVEGGGQAGEDPPPDPITAPSRVVGGDMDNILTCPSSSPTLESPLIALLPDNTLPPPPLSHRTNGGGKLVHLFLFSPLSFRKYITELPSQLAVASANDDCSL